MNSQAETSHSIIRHWHAPKPEEIGHSIYEFIEILGKPTLISFAGRDSQRTRVISTLLHGNEPSGLHAVFNWIKSAKQPATNVYFFIGAVQAALSAPGFYFRQLPGEKDLNRCFRAPFDEYQGQVAKDFLELLHAANPECLIDIHNTSGCGPSFAVSIRDDLPHQALVSHFTDRFIVTDLRLGALMEISERDVPTITFECGGAQEESSHELAIERVTRFLQIDDVFEQPAADWGLEILHNPIRVELKPDASIVYSLTPAAGFDVTLPPDVEHLNFGLIDTSTQLGWLGPKGLNCFNVLTHDGLDVTHDILREEENRFYPAQNLKAFMITPNATIAKSDCLFYVVKVG